MIDTWSEGHLLAAWIVMWTVAFAAMALLAAPAKTAAIAMRAGLVRWNTARKQAEQDRELWALAQTDSRVMADLTCAMSRAALRRSASPSERSRSGSVNASAETAVRSMSMGSAAVAEPSISCSTCGGSARSPKFSTSPAGSSPCRRRYATSS